MRRRRSIHSLRGDDFQQLDRRYPITVNVGETAVDGTRLAHAEPAHHGRAGMNPQVRRWLDTAMDVVLDEDAAERLAPGDDFRPRRLRNVGKIDADDAELHHLAGFLKRQKDFASVDIAFLAAFEDADVDEVAVIRLDSDGHVMF